MELKTGSAESTLDDKGRVSIPLRFREFFQGELVITWGTENCAWVMTPVVWERFEQTISSSETLTPEERLYFKNKHLNQAQVVELDKAGRIAIPPRTRKYANLIKDCLVIRSENDLFIWDSATYDTYLAEKASVGQAAWNKLSDQDYLKAN
jgi:MraZ protein